MTDLRISAQRRLHLAGFDPEPAYLHLIIRAAAELQLAVRCPPCKVPGPVHTLPGRPKRARHEPLPGQSSAAQISPGQPVARHVQFPRHPRGHRAKIGVQHITLCIYDWRAY